MEFEFHVTVASLKIEDKQAFIQACRKQQVKPVMIELDQGDCIDQPMFTGIVHSESFEHVKRRMNALASDFGKQGFSTVRTKIEIPAQEECYFHNPMTAETVPYFEWHGKVETNDLDELKRQCEPYGGHISRNSLNANGRVRFITVREHGSPAQLYDQIAGIHEVLRATGIELLKQQHELCVYDSREELDKVWVSEDSSAYFAEVAAELRSIMNQCGFDQQVYRKLPKPSNGSNNNGHPGPSTSQGLMDRARQLLQKGWNLLK
ncbi:hypothetical protein [Paenibacillus sp. MMS18-CY102]|uniref:hypothetical protein n=1 Tax=Paenibacillus sp. MMS18-CY102 TaxID=2682849 RepID=UPI001F4494BE|nr:hypothetical protein [Paenibacillus sp. MMS18-CY102]